MMKYTKSELERIAMTHLENLKAMHDLLSIMKHQNELDFPLKLNLFFRTRQDER